MKQPSAPTKSELPPDDDIALFLDHVFWFAPRLPEATYLGLYEWMGLHLSADSRRQLRALFPLDHEHQLSAEHTVAQLLSGQPLQQKSGVWRTEEVPERHVDWPRTYCEALGQVPTRFLSHATESKPDRSVMGALAGLALSWARLLRTYGRSGEHAQRAQKLERAAQATTRLTTPVPYVRSHEQRLQRAGPAHATAAFHIRQALRFWQQPLDRNSLACQTHLSLLARHLLVTHELEAENINDLLEVSTHLTIARAAETGAHGWLCESLNKGHRQKKPELILRNSSTGLCCRISKGKPGPPSEPRWPPLCPASKVQAAARGEDRLIERTEAMGLDSDGHQPDVVLTFWHAERPGRWLHALADAKRNARDGGYSYLRKSIEKMTMYQVAYAGALGLSLSPTLGDFDGPIAPSVTLFARQGVNKVVGINALEQDEIIKRFHAEPRLPSLTAMDFRHFGPCSPWSSPVVSAWFERLARQAADSLALQPATAVLAS